jgi:hypothetical protein
LATNPSQLPAIALILPILRPSAIAVAKVSGRALRALHDLEQLHDIGRREEMRAADVLRPPCRIRHDVDVDPATCRVHLRLRPSRSVRADATRSASRRYPIEQRIWLVWVRH